MKTILRFFFKLLYHQFAFAYDLVAATVSLGRWKDWVMSIFPYIEGTRILEIGFGPGHLQRFLLSQGLIVVGIDESWQMASLTARHIKKHFSKLYVQSKTESNQQIRRIDYAQVNLTRGLAQYLPFRNQAFDTIVATFPAEYIFHEETLLDVRRCLSARGRFIILPVAMQIGRGILDRAMALLFRVTHQAPIDPLEIVKEKLTKPFIKAGFEVEIKELQVKSSLLLVILASPR